MNDKDKRVEDLPVKTGRFEDIFHEHEHFLEEMASIQMELCYLCSQQGLVCYTGALVGTISTAYNHFLAIFQN